MVLQLPPEIWSDILRPSYTETSVTLLYEIELYDEHPAWQDAPRDQRLSSVSPWYRSLRLVNRLYNDIVSQWVFQELCLMGEEAVNFRNLQGVASSEQIAGLVRFFWIDLQHWAESSPRQNSTMDTIARQVYEVQTNCLTKLNNLVFLALSALNTRTQNATNLNTENAIARATMSAFLGVCHHRSSSTSPIRALSIKSIRNMYITSPSLSMNEIYMGMAGIQNMELMIANDEPSDPHLPYQPHGTLGHLIRAASNLKTLGLMSCLINYKVLEFNDIFRHPTIQNWHHWSRLENLHLEDFSVHVNCLLEFLDIHKRTLKDLVIINCVIIDDVETQISSVWDVVHQYLIETFLDMKVSRIESFYLKVSRN